SGLDVLVHRDALDHRELEIGVVHRARQLVHEMRRPCIADPNVVQRAHDPRHARYLTDVAEGDRILRAEPTEGQEHAVTPARRALATAATNCSARVAIAS